MKNKILLLGLTIFLLPLVSLAQQGDFGLGVIVGEPTGLSWKIWSRGTTAIAGAAAWSFGGRDAFHLHADYLFHHFRFFTVSKGRLPFYYGLGVRFLFHEEGEDRTRVGVRLPLGIEYIFAGPPLSLFMEIVPILDLAPGTDFDLNGAVGIRFYF
jgi:hypothetical protein